MSGQSPVKGNLLGGEVGSSKAYPLHLSFIDREGKGQ